MMSELQLPMWYFMTVLVLRFTIILIATGASAYQAGKLKERYFSKKFKLFEF